MGIDKALKNRHLCSEHRLSSAYQWSDPHSHQNYEICMALGGGFTYFVNNHLYALGYGDVMLLTDSDYHKVIMPTDRPYERQVISFLPEALPLNAKERSSLLNCFVRREEIHGRKLTLTESERTAFLQLAQAIDAEGRETVLNDIGQQLALCRLLLLLNRVWQRLTQKPALTASDLYSPQTRLVLDYIEKNFVQNITLDELSAACYLNKHYLCRLFRRETGLRIHDCIVSYRLSRASVLLREGKSVRDAAWLSGFNSTAYFISTFKKKIGMTPYQFALRRPPEEDAPENEKSANSQA